ncbi:MAG: DALR domain-containing protein, partial [Olsenella sp.]
GGGSDHICPHHATETAQCMCNWHTPLANVWMHTGMLTIDGEKMSKSLGNFYTLKEVLDKYPADALRLLMLQTHYRSPLDFSFERLEGSVGTLDRLKSCVKNLRWAAKAAPEDGELNDADHELTRAVREAQAEFTAQMDDDFNTAGGLAAIFGLVTAANTYLTKAGEDISTAATLRAADALEELSGVLGINLAADEEEGLPAELVDLAKKEAGYAGTSPEEAADALIEARAAARKAKNWAVADAIRDGITSLGLVLEDTAAGTRLTKKD